MFEARRNIRNWASKEERSDIEKHKRRKVGAHVHREILLFSISKYFCNFSMVFKRIPVIMYTWIKSEREENGLL